jgi:glutamate-1-semialdehyde 2,1-aminomutase
MTARGDLDRERIRSLHEQELARFRAERPNTMALLERARAHMPNGTPMAWMASDNDQPIYIARGDGPGFTDVDGFRYVDTNASDLAMFCGHANPAIVRAVSDQVARSTQSSCRPKTRSSSPRSSRAGTRTSRTGSSRSPRRRRTPR